MDNNPVFFKDFDPMRFLCRNDREFAVSFAKNYEFLRKGAADPGFVFSAKDKAAVEFCKALKTEYEERMALIASPYYALLNNMDLEGFIDPDGSVDEGKLTGCLAELPEEKKKDILAHVRRYAGLKKGICTGESELRFFFDGKLAVIEEEEKERNVEKARSLHLDGNRPVSEIMDALFDNTKQEELKKWEGLSDPEFLKTVPIKMLDTRVELLELSDIQYFEGIVLKLTEEGSEEIHGVLKARREYLAALYAHDLALRIRSKTYMDLENPKFLDTEEGKLLERLAGKENGWEDRSSEIKDLMEKYVRSLRHLIRELLKRGYTVFPEFEAQCEEGEKLMKADRPAVKVNGHIFFSYNMPSFISVLDQRELLLGGNKGDEVLHLFGTYSGLLKKMAVVSGTFRDGKGLPRIFKEERLSKYRNEIRPVRNRLICLLYDELPEIGEYLDAEEPDVLMEKELKEVRTKVENKKAEERIRTESVKIREDRREFNRVHATQLHNARLNKLMEDEDQKNAEGELHAGTMTRPPEDRIPTREDRKKNAEMLKNASEKMRNKQFLALVKAAGTERNRISVDDFEALSRFMTNDTEKNKKLAELMAGISPDPDATEEQCLYEAMDMMATQFFSFNIPEMDLTDDNTVTRDADVYEGLCGEFDAFRYFTKEHPDYFKDLDEKAERRFLERMEKLCSIVAWYSVRKEIISDPVYMKLDEKEFTLDPDEVELDAKNHNARVELAEKMLKSFVLTEIMIRKNNAKEHVSAPREMPQFREQAYGEKLMKKYVDEYNSEVQEVLRYWRSQA